MKKLTARISPNLMTALKIASARSGRPIAAIVAEAVKDWLRKNDL